MNKCPKGTLLVSKRVALFDSANYSKFNLFRNTCFLILLFSDLIKSFDKLA